MHVDTAIGCAIGITVEGGCERKALVCIAIRRGAACRKVGPCFCGDVELHWACSYRVNADVDGEIEPHVHRDGTHKEVERGKGWLGDVLFVVPRAREGPVQLAPTTALPVNAPVLSETACPSERVPLTLFS